MPELLASFAGAVRCERSGAAPGFTLSGVSAAPPGDEITLVFPAAAPLNLPATLEGARVERLASGEYRISSAAREWRFSAGTAEVHAEVAAAFYRALPPRPVPWLKRVLWSLLLSLAATRAGLNTLRRLRR